MLSITWNVLGFDILAISRLSTDDGFVFSPTLHVSIHVFSGLRRTEAVGEEQHESVTPHCQAMWEVLVVPLSLHLQLLWTYCRCTCTHTHSGVELHPATAVCALWRARAAFLTSTNTQHLGYALLTAIFSYMKDWEERRLLEIMLGVPLGQFIYSEYED